MYGKRHIIASAPEVRSKGKLQCELLTACKRLLTVHPHTFRVVTEHFRTQSITHHEADAGIDFIAVRRCLEGNYHFVTGYDSVYFTPLIV